MTDGIKNFTEVLVASYNKYIKDFWGDEMENSKSPGDFRTLDFVVHSWGDQKCELLGKTPKEAIGEALPEEIDFDDITYMFETFAVKAGFEIPNVITDLFFSAPDAAEEYILSVIDNMDLSINVDKKISDEENKKFCVFMEAVGFLERISPDKAKERVFRIFKECDTKNNSINELVCEAMQRCGFVDEMVEILVNSTKIGEKEHFILQELVHIEDNESVFRCLKACLKKECENIAMTVQIVSDCGDGRLIPLMRKIARNQLKALFDAGKSPYDESKESQEFFLICNAITRIGGNIDDLLLPE